MSRTPRPRRHRRPLPTRAIPNGRLLLLVLGLCVPAVLLAGASGALAASGAGVAGVAGIDSLAGAGMGSGFDPGARVAEGVPVPLSHATLTVGRLQYGGGGDWYANPSSLPNLLAAIRERTGVPVAEREVVVSPLDPGLRDVPFLHMTGHGNVVLTPEERRALRSYLEGGGFLHADDNYGMDEAFRREIALLFPDREMVELPPEHPVFHVVYSFPEGIPKIHEHDGHPPQAFGVFHEGRLMVLYSHETDLGNGWEDPEVHGNPPEIREAALRMGVNLFIYALSQRSP